MSTAIYQAQACTPTHSHFQILCSRLSFWTKRKWPIMAMMSQWNWPLLVIQQKDGRPWAILWSLLCGNVGEMKWIRKCSSIRYSPNNKGHVRRTNETWISLGVWQSAGGAWVLPVDLYRSDDWWHCRVDLGSGWQLFREVFYASRFLRYYSAANCFRCWFLYAEGALFWQYWHHFDVCNFWYSLQLNWGS